MNEFRSSPVVRWFLLIAMTLFCSACQNELVYEGYETLVESPLAEASVDPDHMQATDLFIGAGGPRWFRNTFPSQGHVDHPGPWGSYQGTDRTEWVSSFGVHPSNANFMLQMTDLGRLVYTNTRLGGVEFLPAELPLSYGSTIAFNPHEPKTAYALMYTTNGIGLEGCLGLKSL